MTQDSIVALLKELMAKLPVVTEELARRPDLAVTTDAGVAMPTDPVARARSLIKQRRLRRRFLPGELFHEPAWEMLLALYVARHEKKIMNVKTLVSNADAPATTSQRWIEHLAQLRLVDRVTDPVDRRRIEVSLSDSGRDAIERYLAALG